MRQRRTIDASDNVAVLKGTKAKNNGRYNGNGRHWETPPEVFEPLEREFGFTLDPCATAATAKCAKFYTEADDGLSKSWANECVFMNPPYGREVYAWTRKARQESELVDGPMVVGLLPASTDLAWWHDDVVGHATDIRYLRGRVRFLTGGPYRASGFFASVVVVWGGPIRRRQTLAGEPIPICDVEGCSRAIYCGSRCFSHWLNHPDRMAVLHSSSQTSAEKTP